MIAFSSAVSRSKERGRPRGLDDGEVDVTCAFVSRLLTME
jgi:hypothetical protein